MTGIAQGLNEITSIALGDAAIVKVALGDELIWPVALPFDRLKHMSTTAGGGASSNSNLPLPADRMVGDLAVFYQMGRQTSGGAPADGVPSGATSVVTFALTSQNSRLSYAFKLLDATDVANGFVSGGIAFSSGSLEKATILFRGFAADDTTVAPPANAYTVPAKNTTASSAATPPSQGYTDAELIDRKTVVLGGYMSASNQSASTGYIRDSNSLDVGVIVTPAGPAINSDGFGKTYIYLAPDDLTVGMTDSGDSNVRLAGLVYCE